MKDLGPCLEASVIVRYLGQTNYKYRASVAAHLELCAICRAQVEATSEALRESYESHRSQTDNSGGTVQQRPRTCDLLEQFVAIVNQSGDPDDPAVVEFISAHSYDTQFTTLASLGQALRRAFRLKQI